MKNLLNVLAILLLMVTTQACKEKRQGNNWNTQTKVDQKGLNFIKKGIEGSMVEVRSAEIALTNSQNTRVTAFANTIIADHNKVIEGLKQIQDKKEVTADNALSPESKKMISDLKVKQGADFDKAYVQMMVADHQAAIDLYKNDGEHNTTAAIKNFAEKTLPTLQAHLDSAKAIAASLK